MLKSLLSRASAVLALLTIPFLFVFALLQPDGGGGEGGEGGGGEAGGQGGESGGGEGGAGGSADEPFTPAQQARVDKIVQERLARVKGTPPADYDELKAAAAKLKEIEAANQTELERAQAEAKTAAEQRDAALARATEQAKRSAVMTAAVKAKAVDPDDVYALLPKDAVTVGDDGQVTGAEDAVKALLEAKPHLVGKPATSGSADGGTRTTGGDKPKTLEEAVNARLNA